MKRTYGWAAAAVAAAGAGCGPSAPPPAEASATGAVTLDGKPLENGVVRFKPSAGPQSEAAVAGGKYAAPRLVPGANQVTLQGFKGGAGSTGEPLFLESADGATKTVDVKAGPQTLDFAVKSK